MSKEISRIIFTVESKEKKYIFYIKHNIRNATVKKNINAAE